MAKSKKVINQVFAAVSPDFGPHFGFHARNLEHASEMIYRWNRYHGYGKSSASTVRPIQDDDYEYILGASGDEFMKLFVK